MLIQWEVSSDMFGALLLHSDFFFLLICDMHEYLERDLLN